MINVRDLSIDVFFLSTDRVNFDKGDEAGHIWNKFFSSRLNFLLIIINLLKWGKTHELNNFMLVRGNPEALLVFSPSKYKSSLEISEFTSAKDLKNG